MASEIPCIGLKPDYPKIIVGSNEVIDDGITGFLADPYSLDSLVEKIEPEGVANIKATKKNGLVVGAKTVADEDDLMMITSGGMVIRYSVRDIRPTGRATQGVKLINLKTKDKLVSLAKLAAKE